mmetsp:Transcript_17094/g.35112  ORF Transcript_17094/g.35112 Transcript_17094/m.35112 type:complete len:293 (+) Transcript_17094:369-1247(+)
MLNPQLSTFLQNGLTRTKSRSPMSSDILWMSSRYFLSVLGKTIAWMSALGPSAASAVWSAVPSKSQISCTLSSGLFLRKSGFLSLVGARTSLSSAFVRGPPDSRYICLAPPGHSFSSVAASSSPTRLNRIVCRFLPSWKALSTARDACRTMSSKVTGTCTNRAPSSSRKTLSSSLFFAAADRSSFALSSRSLSSSFLALASSSTSSRVFPSAAAISARNCAALSRSFCASLTPLSVVANAAIISLGLCRAFSLSEKDEVGAVAWNPEMLVPRSEKRAQQNRPSVVIRVIFKM